MSRTICVATGSRAEYGHLQWLVRDIADDPRLTLRLLVTGMHLEPRFGSTYRDIEADGHRIDEKVPLDLSDDSATGVAGALGRGVVLLTEALARIAPDVIVILGDRFEMMATALAATCLRIPIAHIHGGEATEGAMDEAFRHSITKMAHLHFTAAAPYARRVIQLGEAPSRVFEVGTPGLCAVSRRPLMPRDELARSIGLPASARFFLVTYHPATLSVDDPAEGVNALLGALDAFDAFHVVVTGVNADIGNSEVAAAYRRYAARREGRVLLVESLGHHRYLSALTHAEACVGNSSSGLVEAPTVKTPTVNIGPRQQGRLRAASVIDCVESRPEIEQAITHAMDPVFLAGAFEDEPPYGGGGASKRIKEVLATVNLEGIVMKSFHDLPAPGVDSPPSFPHRRSRL